MIVALVIYGVVVGALAAATAWAAEGILAIRGAAVRWVWAAALGLMIVVTAVAPFRATTRPALDSVPSVSPATSNQRTAMSSKHVFGEIFSAIEQRYDQIAAAGGDVIARAGNGLPPSARQWITLSWLAVSVILLAVFGLVYMRAFRLRRSWPRIEVQGIEVRVAPRIGPSVFGLMHPEIVVPPWLLDRGALEQRLVLAHESEHVRARDPLLIAAGCITVAILPWNPAAWWMLSRLRLAVELDCDARVLRHGVAPQSYGALLIDLAETRSQIRLGAAALAGRPSHLERRLIAMKPQNTRGASLRTALLASFGALAVASLVVACEAHLPTATEVKAMDVTSAEQKAQLIPLLAQGKSNVTYIVDGVAVTALKAHAVKADDIAAIKIARAKLQGDKAEVHVMTIDGWRASPTRPSTSELVAKKLAGAALATTRPEPELIARKIKEGMLSTTTSTDRVKSAIVLVDGVRASPTQLKALGTVDIESIEVLKGPAATKAYGTPEAAASGVVSIKMKKASK